MLAIFSVEVAAPDELRQLVNDFVNGPLCGREIPQLRNFAALPAAVVVKIVMAVKGNVFVCQGFIRMPHKRGRILELPVSSLHETASSTR
jgi:hypothetical protein